MSRNHTKEKIKGTYLAAQCPRDYMRVTRIMSRNGRRVAVSKAHSQSERPYTHNP